MQIELAAIFEDVILGCDMSLVAKRQGPDSVNIAEFYEVTVNGTAVPMTSATNEAVQDLLLALHTEHMGKTDMP